MDFLDQILARPDANILVAKANGILASEQKRREQFYNDVSPNDKAEFIQGEVIFHSPVKRRHNQTTLRIAKLIDTFVVKHELGTVGIEKLLISLTRNDYEPDVCFFGKAKSDLFTNDQMRFPVPDLVVEVLSESTEERDRGIKFQDYALHGVEEYWLVDPEQQFVEQYLLKGDKFQLQLKTKDGHIRSEVLVGFEVLVLAFFNDQDNLTEMKHFL